MTINVLGGGSLSIDANFNAGNNATILGGASSKSTTGDNISLGNGDVVSGASLGSGTTVGPRAYLLNSDFPANSQISAGSIYSSSTFLGFVQW